MQTLLGQFCGAFVEGLRPTLDALEDAVRALDDAALEVASAAPRAPLAGLREQVHALVEKVAEQQAYVLVFGPLTGSPRS